jgi:hypothetical protein
LKKRTFIPFEAEPAHAIEDALHHILGGALEVSIFNAQNEDTAGVTGEKPIEESSTRPAYMQIAGRRRRKTNTRG